MNLELIARQHEDDYRRKRRRGGPANWSDSHESRRLAGSFVSFRLNGCDWTHSGQLAAVLAPLASRTVTSIVGFTEIAGSKLYNAVAVFQKGHGNRAGAELVSLARYCDMWRANDHHVSIIRAPLLSETLRVAQIEADSS